MLAAVERHQRLDQFNSLRVPLDVLLRAVAFIPLPKDTNFQTSSLRTLRADSLSLLPLPPSWGKEKEGKGDAEKESQQSVALSNSDAVIVSQQQQQQQQGQNQTTRVILPVDKALFRVATTCAMMLIVIAENKHLAPGGVSFRAATKAEERKRKTVLPLIDTTHNNPSEPPTSDDSSMYESDSD